MVCQAPGCNEERNEVLGHFTFPSPGRGLSVLLSQTASLTLHVIQQDFCSLATVGISEGMSWDMIILCQSKSILGERSLLLEESLLCACVLSSPSIGQLVLRDIRGVNSSVQSQIKTSIRPSVPSNRGNISFMQQLFVVYFMPKAVLNPGHIGVNKTVRNQPS